VDGERKGMSPLGKVDRVLAKMHKVLLTAMALLLALACLLLSAAGVYLYLLDQHGNRTVTSVVDAGNVLAVTQTSGLRTRSLVETTLGFYGLAEPVSISKGEALTLQTRENKRRFLCDANRRCTPLL
jgi:hypothetical protein